MKRTDILVKKERVWAQGFFLIRINKAESNKYLKISVPCSFKTKCALLLVSIKMKNLLSGFCVLHTSLFMSILYACTVY